MILIGFSEQCRLGKFRQQFQHTLLNKRGIVEKPQTTGW